MDQEVTILQALRATKEVNIEERGIPKIYYHGTVLKEYNAIVMTLFDMSLQKCYELQGKQISDLSILLIFRQAVCTCHSEFKYSWKFEVLPISHLIQVEELQYLNRRKVLHNNIKPSNLFLRRTKVFINGEHKLKILNFKLVYFIVNTLLFHS